MTATLTSAYWEHSKHQAKLVNNGVTLIEMKFNSKGALIKIGENRLVISRHGFWNPGLLIRENNTTIGTQKQSGFWGTKMEVILDNEIFTARTKQGRLFNITYTREGVDILTYKLDTLKLKPVVQFEIHSYELPQKQLLLLMAFGFYSIKNAAIEAVSNDFIVVAIA